jgi:preprotein translocase subunit YajC
VCLRPGWRSDQTLPGEQRKRVETSFAFLAATPTPAGGGLTVLLPLLLIPLLYLFMIRPQQKRQKQWQSMLASIKAGDRVTTAGGIRGTILSIKDDAIIIRVAPDNLKLEIAKNAIASVTTQESSS